MKPIILCVDDEQIVLTSLKAQLRRIFNTEFDIEIAESGDEAIEIIEDMKADGAEFPLIISDQIMPGMSGDELLVYTHKNSSETLSIMLTGQADANAIGRAVNNANLYRYISKPWNETDLQMTVKEAIRSFQQAKKIKEQHLELQKYNEHLEELVTERTLEVTKQKEIIEKKNDDILASINYATRIQKAILPQEKYFKNIVDNFVLYMPKDIVSGDFFWLKEKDDKIYVAAADCTGHGVPGAFMSMLGVSFLNEIIKICDKPDGILNILRDRVISTLNDTNEEALVQDGMDIALSVYDKKAKTLEFSGAYNPLLVVRNNEIVTLKADRMPIGVHVKDKNKFTAQKIDVKPNDKFYMFSDGYIDQFGGKEDKRLKMKNFKNLILDIHKENFDKQKELLSNHFKNWRGKNSQIDDIVIIGFSF